MFYLSRRKIFWLILSAVIIFCALILFFYVFKKEKYTVINFLDVGQGDAILIETPNGKTVLIDGGSDEKILKRLRRRLPWYERKIDLMVLTHAHDDHAGGLIDVLKRYRVKKIVYTGLGSDSPIYRAFLDGIKKEGAEVIKTGEGEKFELDKNISLDFLYPDKNNPRILEGNLNNASLVAKLICGEKEFLLTGDAEAAVEEKLLSEHVDLSADVLKIGHHGSDFSSSEKFLEAASPDFAVIQVGKDNKFGHPNLRIIKRLERIGAKILRTDQDGDILFKTNGDYLELVD